jgi:hypothetical protein
MVLRGFQDLVVFHPESTDAANFERLPLYFGVFLATRPVTSTNRIRRVPGEGERVSLIAVAL